MAKLDTLSVEELETKRKQLALMQMGIASIGTIGGWIYANKTGGGFWRYVGFRIYGRYCSRKYWIFYNLSKNCKNRNINRY